MKGILSLVFFIWVKSIRVVRLYLTVGNHQKEPGKQVYSVPFQHGTLQIGFFNQVLHGVESWVGQRCGIQLNIKKDVLEHFIRFGTEHYDKFRITGYPKGPIIFF